MIEKVKRFAEQYHMLEKGCRVVVGLSGGADSVCLLLLLQRMSRETGFFLAAVHVEHGIRGEESRKDAAFAENLCREHKIPFESFSVDVPRRSRETGESPEEAARVLRYGCFRESCRRFRADRVAVAHHAGDNAETMLFHLARGTGIRGLGGIAPVGRLPEKACAEGESSACRIIRPLLCVTRDEIEVWLSGQGQSWRTDSTNTDTSYSRNRIRGRVLPELEQVNAQAVPHMREAAQQLREACDFLDEEAWRAGAGAWEERVGQDSARFVCIFTEPFGKIHPYLQKHLLLLLLGRAAGSRKDITAFHVGMVLELTRMETGRRVSLPGGMYARRTGDGVELSRETGAERRTSFSPRSLRIPGETMLENGLRIRTEIRNVTDFLQEIPKKTYTKWFDYDKIRFNVQLRTRRSGDYLQIDADGGHKSLKKYFVDEKIPREERDQICLLTDADHVMWVVGYRISEAYKVDGQTRHILQVEVIS
ncbi:MAG: tRNA lysidine(34) synthetase TilS [Clostridiales bacterium]|nr:tRNA lysidine(34) synthetase TilS [Clostridiales bacterium]